MTVIAGIANDRAGTVTTRASLLHREETLLHTYLAMTSAGGTGARFGALFGAATVTGLAAGIGRHTNFYRGTAYSIFKRQFQVVTQVGTTIDSLATASAASAAKNIAEYVTENITEIGPATTRTTAHARVNTGVAKLVIGSTLLRVAQYLVGFFRLFEFFLGFCAIRIAIRMVFLRCASVGFFHLRIAGVFGDAQGFVIISF